MGPFLSYLPVLGIIREYPENIISCDGGNIYSSLDFEVCWAVFSLSAKIARRTDINKVFSLWFSLVLILSFKNMCRMLLSLYLYGFLILVKTKRKFLDV